MPHSIKGKRAVAMRNITGRIFLMLVVYSLVQLLPQLALWLVSLFCIAWLLALILSVLKAEK